MHAVVVDHILIAMVVDSRTRLLWSPWILVRLPSISNHISQEAERQGYILHARFMQSVLR